MIPYYSVPGVEGSNYSSKGEDIKNRTVILIMMLKVYTFDLVKQRSTNYELETVLVNKVLLVHYSVPFTSDCLWLFSHDGWGRGVYNRHSMACKD